MIGIESENEVVVRSPVPGAQNTNSSHGAGGSPLVDKNRSSIKFHLPEEDRMRPHIGVSDEGDYSDEDEDDQSDEGDDDEDGDDNKDKDKDKDKDAHFVKNNITFEEQKWSGRTWAPYHPLSSDFVFESTEIYEAAYGYYYRQYLTGRKSLDRICNIWHVLFLFLSVCLVLFGVVLNNYFGSYLIFTIQKLPTFAMYSHFVKQVDSSTDIVFSGYIQEIGVGLIVLNSLYLVCSLTYMLFPFHKFPFTLPLLCLVCGILCVIEMSIANINFSTGISRNENLIDMMQEKLRTEYQINGNSPFTVAYDYMSIWLSCCGIVDRHDFQQARLKTTDKIYFHRNLQVSPTCCKAELFEQTGDKGRESILECAARAKPIYQDGCFSVLIQWLEKECRYYSVVVVVHLMDCLIHAYIYKHRTEILQKALVDKFGTTPLNKISREPNQSNLDSSSWDEADRP